MQRHNQSFRRKILIVAKLVFFLRKTATLPHGRRIKISELHEEKTKLALPKLKTSAKSVQTTAEVCADYTCSLYRLQLKSPESTTYLQI